MKTLYTKNVSRKFNHRNPRLKETINIVSTAKPEFVVFEDMSLFLTYSADSRKQLMNIN